MAVSGNCGQHQVRFSFDSVEFLRQNEKTVGNVEFLCNIGDLIIDGSPGSIICVTNDYHGAVPHYRCPYFSTKCCFVLLTLLGEEAY